MQSRRSMPRDVDSFAFAREFPDAVLALAGIRGRGHTATSIAAKEQSRALDLVFRGRGPRAPLIYMEVQDRGDLDVERSALIKLAVLCDQLRCWRAAQAVILFATDASLRRARRADVALRGKRSISFTPLRVVLSQIAPETLLARGGPALGLLPLVGQGREVSARAAEWYVRLLRDRSIPRRQRARLEDFFDRFLRRRTRGRLHVEAPVFVEKIKGVKELVAAGEARGEARGRHASIRAILEARLGHVPKAFLKALEATTDLERLDAAVQVAAVATSLAEVERTLAARRRSRRSPPR
jgi:hypothetical protein